MKWRELLVASTIASLLFCAYALGWSMAPVEKAPAKVYEVEYLVPQTGEWSSTYWVRDVYGFSRAA